MNEYGDELYHPDGSPYLKGPPTKRRNQQESRGNFSTPHARNNATSVGGSGPRDGIRNNYTQKERGPGRGTGRFTPKERNTPGERKFLPCRVCKESTHSGLFGCADFKKYIPGGPNGASSLSKDICKLCLGTVFNECKHIGLRHYQKYWCKQSDVFFLVCHKCKKHENAQEWMRVNHNPKIGVKNLDTMFSVLGTDHVQINSISIKTYNI